MVYQPFPKTHWSLVRRAGFAEGQDRHEALVTLLMRYQPALLSYLLNVRHLPQEFAEELLQEFIANKVLEYELLRHAKEGLGRFRTFLLTSLNRFAIDHFRLLERKSISRLELKVGEQVPSPTMIVEAAWAKALVRQVLENMYLECERSARQDIWKVFERRILINLFEGKAPISYEHLAKELQIGSPTQVANLLVTAKRMYARFLRAAVAEYEIENNDIEAEIAELRRILATPEFD